MPYLVICALPSAHYSFILAKIKTEIIYIYIYLQLNVTILLSKYWHKSIYVKTLTKCAFHGSVRWKATAGWHVQHDCDVFVPPHNSTGCFTAVWNLLPISQRAFPKSNRQRVGLENVIKKKKSDRLPEIAYDTSNNCPWIKDLKEGPWETRGSGVHCVPFECSVSDRATGGGGGGWWRVKRSRLSGLQAGDDGEDEVPERGVLSDEEAWWVRVCMLQEKTQSGKGLN